VHSDDLPAESVRLSGIVAGVWMLRGENWARWLAIAWIVFGMRHHHRGGGRRY